MVRDVEHRFTGQIRMNRPHDLPALATLSARIGADPLLIQGAGGNTSVKEGGVMWIKASGTNLADALTRDVFVPCDLPAMRAAICCMKPPSRPITRTVFVPITFTARIRS